MHRTGGRTAGGLALLSVLALATGGGEAGASARSQAPFADHPLVLAPASGDRLSARGSRGNLVLDRRGPAFVLSRGGRVAVVRMALPRARRPVAEARLPGVVHDHRGDDPSRWRTGLPTYGRARYRQVWRGIDVVVHGDGGQVEYDFMVAPGADPRAISVRIGGVGRPRIDRGGRLVVDTHAGRLVQRAPVLFQRDRQGRSQRVAGRFVLRGRTLRFAVGDYDRARELVIDPVVIWSSFHGGDGNDSATAVAVAPDGGVVVAGRTTSTDLPPADEPQGADDAFVTKFSADGATRAWTTYLGGSQADEALGVDVAATGVVYVAGSTLSEDFPASTEYGGEGDGFWASLAGNGSLARAEFVGGDGTDHISDVAVGASAARFGLTGATRSQDFPGVAEGTTEPGGGEAPDAFFAEVSPGVEGIPTISSAYLGGGDRDVGTGIAFSGGSYVVVGETSSADLPGTSEGDQSSIGGDRDAFAASFAVSMFGIGRGWATFLGGTGREISPGVTVSPDGDTYVVGGTQSADFPTLAAFDEMLGGDQDAFVARLDTVTGDRLLASYLGDGADDIAVGVAVAPPSGRVWAVGATSEVDGSDVDAALWRLLPRATQLADLTRLETEDEAAELAIATGVAAASDGDAIVAGATDGARFPATSGVAQETKAEGLDAFVTRVDDEAIDTTAPQTTIDSGPSGSVRGATQHFTFSANEPATFACTLDGVTTAGCTSPFEAVVTATGSHTFSVVATDTAGNTDGSPATRAYSVHALAPVPPETVIDSGPSGTVGQGEELTFTFSASPAEPGVTFECRLGDADFAPCTSPLTITEQLALGAHNFRVRLVDAGGVRDPSPAVRTFTVADQAPPDTILQGGPQGAVRGAEQRFTFSSTEPGSTFTCRVDPDGVSRPCTSPFTTPALSLGTKTLRVTATDAAGNTDPTPAERVFTIYAIRAQLPDTVITSAPPPLVRGGEAATFAFAADPDEPGIRFECAVDEAGFAPCTSPVTIEGLSEGDHRFRVRLRDAQDVVDPSPAEDTFTVVRAPGLEPPAPVTPPAPAYPAPVARLATVPSALVGHPVALDATASTGEDLRYAFDADGDGAFEHSTGSEPTLAHTAPTEPGEYQVGVLVTDGAGRRSSATATMTVVGPVPQGLVASTNKVRPGGSVTFNARGRAGTRSLRAVGDSAYYGFAFGDGSPPRTTAAVGQWSIPGAQVSPVSTHQYANPGTYSYGVTTTLGAQATQTAGQMLVDSAADKVVDSWTGGVVEVTTSGGFTGDATRGLPFLVDVTVEGESTLGGVVINGQPVKPTLRKNGAVFWNFGDGTPTVDTTHDSTHATSHTYTLNGNPTVTLTMTYVSENGQGTRILRIPVKVRDRLCADRELPFAGDLKFTAGDSLCLESTGEAGQWVTAAGAAVRLNKNLFLRHASGGRLYVSPKTGAIGVAPGSPGQMKASMTGIDLVPPKGGLTGITVNPALRGYRTIPQLTHTDKGKSFNDLDVVRQTVGVATGGAGAWLAVVLPYPFTNPVANALGNKFAGLEGTSAAPTAKPVGGPTASAAAGQGDFSFELEDEQFGPVSVSATLKRQSGRLMGGGSISVLGLDFLAPYLEKNQITKEGNRTLSGPSGFAISPTGGLEHAGFALFADPALNVLGAFGLSKIGAKLQLRPSLFFRGDVAGNVPYSPAIASFDVCVQMQQMKAKEATRFCLDDPFLEQFVGADCVPKVMKYYEDLVRKDDPKYFYPRLPYVDVWDPTAKAEDPERLANFRAAVKLLAESFTCKGQAIADFDQFWLTVKGKLSFFGFDLRMRFSYRNSDEENFTLIDFHGGFDEKFGPIRVRAGVGGTMQIRPTYRWQFDAEARISLGSLFEVGGALLVNDDWLAGCAKLGPFQASGGYNWDTGDFEWPDEKYSCLANLKHFFDFQKGVFRSARAAQFVPRQVGPTMGRPAVEGIQLDGSADTQLMIRGTTGIPRVVLTGPGGVRIQPDGSSEGPGWRAETYPEVNMVQIGIAKPAAGSWTVETLPESPTIQAVSGGTPDRKRPVVRATVVKRDGRHVLRYLVERRKGLTVRFYDETPTGQRTPIGSPKAKQGGIRFQPPLGNVGRRRIVAVLEQDGFPQEPMTVASYRAPRPARPGRPAGLVARRRGGRILVRWAPVAGAIGYEVLARSGTEKPQRVEVKAKRARRVELVGLPSTKHTRIAVRALASGDRRSRSRRAVVRRSTATPRRLLAAPAPRAPKRARRP